MPCTIDPTPEEIRRSVEATQKHERDVRNTISDLGRMLCTMCRMAKDEDRPIPIGISEWYDKHLESDKKRLAAAKKSGLSKLSDDEKEALGL